MCAMSAESIARALGGRKVGHGWTARCPAHDDREPSLSIRDADGKVLVRCHAGCNQRDAIAALKERGLWDGKANSSLRTSCHRKVSPPRPDPEQVERSAVALSIWQSTIAAGGTPVEAYLVSRGLNCSLPSALRFHPGLRHPSGGVWPCMVARVTRGADDKQVAIHRTFLVPEGRSKAPVAPAKMMLGPCHGGAVHLGEPGELLMIGEGIETCLAAMQATGHPAWAALSTSGLRALELPYFVKDVIVLADGDDPGEDAARDAALRLKRDGRRLRIARPPRGLDFNDVLLGRVPGIEEGAQ
jgi:putative DNA primase/helicase